LQNFIDDLGAAITIGSLPERGCAVCADPVDNDIDAVGGAALQFAFADGKLSVGVSAERWKASAKIGLGERV